MVLCMPAKPSTKIRLSDIARKTSVSVATVSMALQNHPAIKHATRVAIKQAARELGYRRHDLGAKPTEQETRPASADRLGFITVEQVHGRIHDLNYTPMVDVLMREAPKMGIRMQMASITSDTPVEEVTPMLRRFADGLDGLLVSGEVRRPLVKALQELNVPFVVAGGTDVMPEHPESQILHRVTYDAVAMAATAVRYLAARGRKRIALMNGNIANSQGFWAASWEQGYLGALAQAGITPDPALNISYRLGEGEASWIHRLASLTPHVDAIIWAEIGMAASARPQLAAAGIELDPLDEVFSGQRHRAASGPFAGHPWVMENNATLARQGIWALRSLIVDPTRPPGALVLPFESMNLHFAS